MLETKTREIRDEFSLKVILILPGYYIFTVIRCLNVCCYQRIIEEKKGENTFIKECKIEMKYSIFKSKEEKFIMHIKKVWDEESLYIL